MKSDKKLYWQYNEYDESGFVILNEKEWDNYNSIECGIWSEKADYDVDEESDGPTYKDLFKALNDADMHKWVLEKYKDNPHLLYTEIFEEIKEIERYEDASLTYTGINKHEGKSIGLYDTVISSVDEAELFENKEFEEVNE